MDDKGGVRKVVHCRIHYIRPHIEGHILYTYIAIAGVAAKQKFSVSHVVFSINSFEGGYMVSSFM